jgi:hypothetical protein
MGNFGLRIDKSTELSARDHVTTKTQRHRGKRTKGNGRLEDWGSHPSTLPPFRPFPIRNPKIALLAVP